MQFHGLADTRKCMMRFLQLCAAPTLLSQPSEAANKGRSSPCSAVGFRQSAMLLSEFAVGVDPLMKAQGTPS